MKQSKVIGLTGGSGSGKSTVAKVLEHLGALIIDCDKIAHENMLKGGIAYNDIVNAFGRGILLTDGEIDRRKLGSIVFSDRTALSRLNSIAHPYIVDRVRTILSDVEGLAVIDAALLYEVGLDRLCDEVWVTQAPYSVRIERIMERDGITRQEAENRLSNQGKYDRGDRIIVTDFATLEDLEKYIKELI